MSAQSSERPEDNLQDIRRRLDEATQKLNALVMKPRESLRDFEYRVKRHSDKLLSLKVARTSSTPIARTGHARDAEEQLKKRNPDLRREILLQDQGLAGPQCSLSRRERNPNRFETVASALSKKVSNTNQHKKIDLYKRPALGVYGIVKANVTRGADHEDQKRTTTSRLDFSNHCRRTRRETAGEDQGVFPFASAWGTARRGKAKNRHGVASSRSNRRRISTSILPHAQRRTQEPKTL